MVTSYKIKILPKAYNNDLINAKEWYNEQRDFLGEEFKAEVNAEIDHIFVHPENYQLKFRDLKQAVLKRFPYIIFFLADDNLNQIIIFGILHSKQSPKIIKRRLP